LYSGLLVCLSVIMLFGFVTVIGCGGGGEDGDSSCTYESVAGTYTGTATSDDDGESVSIWVTFYSDGTLVDSDGDLGTYELSGCSITGTVNEDGGYTTFGGSISGSTMSGTWSNSDGDSGTLEITKQ